MSKNARLKRRACHGKQRFSCHKETMTAIAALHRHRGYQGPLRPYRCRFCNSYHYGHWRAKSTLDIPS
jgi:hypothetical protein